MFPPANDLIALLGINLVLSAGCLRLLNWRHGVTPWGKWASAAVFLLLWCPVGPARLPLVAYVRGISSDLSISLVAIACLGMTGHLLGGAGGIESVFTVLSLHHQKIPPTINIFNQDPECDLD